MNDDVQKLATRLVAEQLGMLIIEAKTAEAERHFLGLENQKLRQQLQASSKENVVTEDKETL